MFDPQALINTTFEGGFSTVRVPIPENEYQAVIAEEPKAAVWNFKTGEPGGLKLQIQWEILDEELARKMERKKVVLRDEIMLDVTETGMLDKGKGKNVQLGRLLEALGLNKPGVAWTFQQMVGRPVLIAIKHDVQQRDGEEPVTYERVKAYAKFA